MDTLKLGEYEPPNVRLETEPREYKSPGKAFFLSLVLPGAGQYYCGKTTRGIVTFLFIVLPILLIAYLMTGPQNSGNDELIGYAFFFAMILYPFAFLDAYFTAREINAGQDYVTAPSPRVAAVLNLLTNGFGYIYVGWRRTGIFALVALGFFVTFVGGMMGTAAQLLFHLLPIGIQIVLSVHVYKIAKRHLEEFAEPPAIENPSVRNEPEGMSPIIPVGLAGFFGFAYLSLVILGLAAMSSERGYIDNLGETTFSLTDNGLRYKNPRFGFEIEIPSGWKFDSPSPLWLVSASTDNGCVLKVTVWAGRAPSSETLLEKIVVSEFVELEPKAKGDLIRKRLTLSGGPAQEITGVFTFPFSDYDVYQRRIYAYRNKTLYRIQFNAYASDVDACTPDFESITKSVILPN